MSSAREIMEAEVRKMLKEKGIEHLYENQIEEVGYVLVNWLRVGNMPESLVFALVNKTLPLQALLAKAKVVKIASRDGHCISDNKVQT